MGATPINTLNGEIAISDIVRQKLEALQEKLGVDDLNLALDKNLNIAYFIADTVSDPRTSC